MSAMMDLESLKVLNENSGFLKVFFAIIFVQALIVNAPLVPLQVVLLGSEICSAAYRLGSRLDHSHLIGSHHDPGRPGP